MAFREVSVIEVRKVLHRYVVGESVRTMARRTGGDRKIVTEYLRAGQGLGVRHSRE